MSQHCTQWPMLSLQPEASQFVLSVSDILWLEKPIVSRIYRYSCCAKRPRSTRKTNATKQRTPAKSVCFTALNSFPKQLFDCHQWIVPIGVLVSDVEFLECDVEIPWHRQLVSLTRVYVVVPVKRIRGLQSRGRGLSALSTLAASADSCSISNLA